MDSKVWLIGTLALGVGVLAAMALSPRKDEAVPIPVSGLSAQPSAAPAVVIQAQGGPQQLAAVPAGQPASVVAGDNAFAADLYGRLAKQAGNVFISPYSISTALAMTGAGAAGNTAAQMSAALRISLGDQATHAAVGSLMKLLNGAGRGYELATANALWGQSGVAVKQAFLDTTAADYGAGYHPVSFKGQAQREKTRAEINGWVQSQTNDKIKNLIAAGVLTELTRLVLTNAVYFKGAWAAPFTPSQTAATPFHTGASTDVTVQMMHRTGSYAYAETPTMQLLELPYKGGTLAMDVLLPRPGTSLAAVEQSLTADGLGTLVAPTTKRTVEVFLPRFKMEYSATLNKELTDMGMADAFDESRADFSGISSDLPLYIAAVLHKAYVDVNEQGTEAAAATAVIVSTKGLSLDVPPVFRADHPFVFAIRDLGTGAILFMGRLADPTA